MKKFLSLMMLVMIFLVAGCDKGNDGLVDLSNNDTVKSQMNADQFYGQVVHKGVPAVKLIVKNIKFNDNLYAYTFYMKPKSGDISMVSFICDLRANTAGVSYVLRTNQGEVPKGNVEISIMSYTKGITEIRETDENKDPIFSTANGDTDFLAGISKAANLPGDTILAFVIDKPGEGDAYKGVAWSPLFTAKQLDKEISKVRDNCNKIKINLNDEYIVPADGH